MIVNKEGLEYRRFGHVFNLVQSQDKPESPFRLTPIYLKNITKIAVHRGVNCTSLKAYCLNYLQDL